MADTKPTITFRVVPGTEAYRVEGESLALIGKLVKLAPGQVSLVCGKRIMNGLALKAHRCGMKVVIAA